MIKKILFIALACLLFGCWGSNSGSMQNKTADLALSLNNQAVQLMTLAGSCQNSDESNMLYLQADSLLVEAIRSDSTLRMATANRVSLMFALHRYTDAIKILKEQSISQKIAEDYFMLGLAYERVGDIESANKNYSLALSMYNKRIAACDSASISDILNRGVTHLMLNDCDSNRTEIIKQLDKLPDCEFAIKIIENFNKEEFTP